VDKTQKLQELANSDNPIVAKNAKDQLERLATEGAVQVQVASATGNMDAEVMAIIDALNAAVSGGVSDPDEVRKIVIEELRKIKIDYDDLSDSLKSMLNSSKKVEVVVRNIVGKSTTTSSTDAFLKRPLVQDMLSDMMAKNNVYLYGGAGTGKTYSAEEISKLFGWELIAINCNQFTSPIDIIGGQTIEGYQEGKLTMAWSNEIIDEDGTMRKVDGCVLLLDELPKIDPNTAGLMNEALAKVKDFKYDEVTNTLKAPYIRNGRSIKKYLGNLFIMATGNVPLNTIDPDYEANFKQDLSLQDRFIGSTYKVFVDYDYEFNSIMKGYAFIWIFATKMREAIIRLNATGQAFVSIRLMMNLKATYQVYREAMLSKKKGQQLIEDPKDLMEALESFMELFKPAIKDALISELPIAEFKRTIEEKNNMPYEIDYEILDGKEINIAVNNFDTQDEIKAGNEMVKNYKASQQKQRL
jgi:cobaltochelatase CobS